MKNFSIKRCINGQEIEIELDGKEIQNLYDNFVLYNVRDWVEDELFDMEIEVDDTTIEAIATNATNRIVGLLGSESHSFWEKCINEEIQNGIKH